MYQSLRDTCSVWPAEPVDNSFSKPINSAIPTLLLSGALDTVTPPGWAHKAMPEMSNARHFVSPYASHGLAMQTCANRLVADLIDQGSVQELDDIAKSI